ncbi:Heavy metal RND efflux membrane fusion protein, CzcB family (fragment) [uncultured Pleomorphomonas sp.]|uniref:Heavy metal RND efflux membrane fusion protein, CzcB family n=1 Tax=uncultured Pleomorphomonas sp. TaxID=442121 RepID=A0A212LEC1_9HYPH
MTRSHFLVAVAALAILTAAGLPFAIDALAQSGHAGHGAAAPTPPAAGEPAAGPAPVAPAPGARRVLYYRNPMGLPDTSPVPKKDAMGMAYVPVYADEDTSGTVTVSADKIQTLGVRTEAAALRAMTRSVRAVGAVAVDERNEYQVAPRFEAWIERLIADTTGASVRRGDVLMEVYSPELVLAQEEYLSARGDAGLAEAALARLRNLGIADEEIARLKATGKAMRTLPYRAEADGIVLEKLAVRGMRFMPGETLYRIADLSEVWMLAEVFEQDLPAVRVGETAEVAINSMPDRRFTGTVDFLYPTLAAESRTAKVRIELANPDGLLRPNLYGTVHLAAASGLPALAVPDSAVLDSGTRKVVLVESGDGRFAPREVKTGPRADGYIRIDGGLDAGEKVVTRANFLIDSESNLRSALAAFAPAAADAGEK